MAPSDDEAQSAYAAGLVLLARRELSEAQVRQRLLRKGHRPEVVDAAVLRLKSERAIDDSRVAEAIARTEVAVRRRGHHRVTRRIESAGIDASVARRAAEQVYADVDSDALLAASIDRRLRGRAQIADQKEFQRLYRHLIGQGFDADKVLAALRVRARRVDSED